MLSSDRLASRSMPTGVSERNGQVGTCLCLLTTRTYHSKEGPKSRTGVGSCGKAGRNELAHCVLFSHAILKTRTLLLGTFKHVQDCFSCSSALLSSELIGVRKELWRLACSMYCVCPRTTQVLSLLPLCHVQSGIWLTHTYLPQFP